MNIRSLVTTGEQEVKDLPGTEQFLTFTMGAERFAAPIDQVREIVPLHALTPVPLSPDFLLGVTNLRGSVVPVVDLPRRFGRKANTIGHRTCIIVAEIPHQEKVHPIGILVESVNTVETIDPSRIDPPPEFGLTLRKDFIRCLVRMGSDFVICLDLPSCLSLEEISSLASRHQESRSISTNPLAIGDTPWTP
ncbi:MAG: purine-binding chemotaxis protein CheW [Fibrobacteria bacterium]|nr:purine-binding chemotaxis protein CheW [Fibrobacteria bacterium]